VFKGRNEVTVTANSTDSATVSIRGPRRSLVAQLIRIGDCAQ
jgi:hypothetical protein